jgi:alpha-tubulin suppressor-like RCC1 family protein
MGNNNFGQLGDGTTTLRTTPVKIADGVIAAAAGDGFSLFLKSDGSLWGSGNSNYGQLGVNGWWNSTPVLLASGVTGMSAGDSHTLFLKSNSTLWAMGYNDYGQLGDGTATSRSSPVQVDDGVIAESAGDSDTIFLKADSRVWATGYNFTGQLGDGTTTNRSNPVPMIGGTAFSPSAPAGLTASAGTVVNAVRLSWNPTVGAANYEIWRSSSNDFSGATLLASNVPSAIYFDATAAIGTTYYYWVEAANQVGTSGASTVSSGYNVPWIAPSIVTPPTDQAANIGEHATFTTAAAGDPVPTLQWQRAPAGSTTWSDLAEGTSYVGVTSPTLTVYGTTFAMNGDQFRCVASNTDAQVISNAAKLTVRPVAGVVAVVGGQFYNLFIRADGTLWGTGDNGRGELGDGTTTNRTMPVQVANGVVTAAAGAAHSLFVKSDGTLWAMGSNSNGQLGDGTTTNHTMPVQVANGVVTASCGAAHSLFVKSDGTLWAMGSNSNGQLGDGTNMDRSTPVQVANGVVAVSAGGSHSLFVKSDGTLWAVGWNGSGQLGDGTNTSRTSPVQVASGVATVAAGLEHSLFVKSDGTLWGMGNSGDGELGYVTTIACTSPVQVASDVVTAAAGANHSVFVKSDSTLWAMGYDWGHFEIFSPGAGGTVIPATCLVQIASDVVAVAAGNSNSLFAKSDGTLWAMGDNYSGELGDGSLISRWTPVQVGGGLPQLPEMPSGLTASQGTFPCAVFLSWIPVIGANHYEVWRNTANSAATAALIAGNVSGALYSDSAAVPAISYYYWVRAVNFAGASDYCGSANGSIPLIAPAVTTQPASREVVSGQSVSFSIAVSASPAPSYQWQRSVNGGNDWSNLANDTTYSGVTTATLTVSGATLAMRAHQFRCAVDNGVGSVATSPAVLTVDPALVVTTFAGMGGFRGFADGTGSAAQFQYPAGIAIDGSGNLFVADTNNCTIRKVTSAGVVSTLAGSPLNFGSADGVGSAAQFDFPSGIATDGSGNLYVADASNHTIRRVTQAGVVTTVAGVAGHSGCTDGTGSMALFSFPSGIATDGSGNMYVADTNNTIRKVTPVGVVTTLAGMGGLSGSVDGTGTSAQFNFPKNIAIDATRNLYVTDTNNNTIRKITPAGVVTTIAGLAGYYGNSDGAGSVARFAQPAGVAVDSVGNLYVTDGNNTIRRVTPGGVVTTVAGLAGFYGNSDGTGSAAQFYLPVGLVVDSTGSLYIMDAGNDTIRKGVFQTVPLLTGQPSNEAAVTGQSVRLAVGLSGWSPANCQWQCSTNNGTPWSNLANDGTDSGATTSALTIANVTPGMNGWQYRCQVSSSTQANETSSAATLMIVGPPSFATQPADQVVFVGASANFTVTTNGAPAPGCQWRASTDGGTTWSDLNNGDTYAGVTTATLTVRGATLAMNGSLYRCVATNSEGTATSNNGSLSVFPQVLAPAAGAGEGVVSSGFVLNWSSVSGATGYRLDVSTDSSFGSFVNGYQNLDVGSATSKALSGLNANTTYYVRVRAYNGAGVGANSSTITVTTTPTISITTPLTVSTLAGQVLSTGSADGTGNAARFYYPSGVAADSAGNLYIADTDNHTLRKVIASTGAVTTLAGLAGNSGSADATGSAARFNNPSGVAVDGAGNIYVADTLNHTLRKVTSAGVVSTLAGATGSSGSADGTGSAARFQGPQGLAFNSSGVLYVADTNNHTIRMVVPSTGVVTTVAGLAGNSGSTDGLGNLARFNYPSGVAVDSAGNIYVADTENHTIRAITPSGLVTTSAGLAGSSGGADGAGSASRFNSPAAISVDPSGNVYVADTDNHTIRMVVPSTGTTSTLAGLAGTSGSADGIGAAVRFFAPTGLAMDHNSNLYIADTNNDTLRLGLLPAIPAIQNQPQSQTVTAGNSVQFSVTASGRPAPTYQWYFNGNAITGATGNSYSLTNAQASNAGNYTVAVTNAMGGKTSDPATLTVTPVTSPPSGGGGGGGGGGGAPSLWFLGSLLLLAAARRSFGRRQ